MDEDVRQAFEGINARLDRLMVQINTKLDDLLSGMEAIRRDADTTRGHLAFVLEDSVTLGRRLTRLERP